MTGRILCLSKAASISISPDLCPTTMPCILMFFISIGKRLIGFSLPAKIYIFSTILVGCGILAWILHNHAWQNLWAMFFLSGLASLALFFKVEGTTNRSHYNISFLIYGCTFAILGPEVCH